jgi:hypothetical protein
MKHSAQKSESIHTNATEQTPQESATDPKPPPSREFVAELFRHLADACPSELGMRCRVGPIPIYQLPKEDGHYAPPDRLPRFDDHLADLAKLMGKPDKTNAELVQAIIHRPLFGRESNAEEKIHNFTEDTGELLYLLTQSNLTIARRARVSSCCSSRIHNFINEIALLIIRETVHQAQTGDDHATFRLIELTEDCVKGLNSQTPPLELLLKSIAPLKEEWSLMCGALPEDVKRTEARIADLGVATKAKVKHTYSKRGRPISYEIPVNRVAKSLVEYMVETRQLPPLDSSNLSRHSCLPAELCRKVLALDALTAQSAKAWVAVAEEIVELSCGKKLEEVSGLAQLGNHRKGKTQRQGGNDDTPFAGDIRDGVRTALVQAFRTIARDPTTLPLEVPH